MIVRTGVLGSATGGVYDGLTRYLQTGYNAAGGYWDGPGINSSVAAADDNTGVGIVSNSELGYGTWPPLEPRALAGGNEILIKFTYFGDSTLDGLTNNDDFQFFQPAYVANLTAPGSVSGWINGDYDYNGVVNNDDFGFFSLGFNQSPPIGFSRWCGCRSGARFR